MANSALVVDSRGANVVGVLPAIKLFFNEIHSKDKKERYIAKKVEELKKEDEKKKNETGLLKKKRGQIIINETKNKTVSRKNQKT